MKRDILPENRNKPPSHDLVSSMAQPSLASLETSRCEGQSPWVLPTLFLKGGCARQLPGCFHCHRPPLHIVSPAPAPHHGSTGTGSSLWESRFPWEPNVQCQPSCCNFVKATWSNVNMKVRWIPREPKSNNPHGPISCNAVFGRQVSNTWPPVLERSSQ